MSIINLFTDVFRNPAILLGGVAFLGLAIQKMGWSEILSGTIKTVMGFVILQLGGNIIADSLDIFSKLFANAFHIMGVIPSNEAVVSIALAKVGSLTALIMLFGMLVNIVIARFTKLRYIYLTGHVMVYMSCVLASIMYSYHLSSFIIVCIGAIVMGFYMSLAPYFLSKASRVIIGSDDYTIGHSGALSYYLAARIGRFVGDPIDSIESVKMPRKLMFLQDTVVSVSLTMLILFLIVVLIADPDYVVTLAGSTSHLVFSVIQAVTFTGGLFVVLAGVKMFINEIVPAYKGIAEKLVPGSVPAVDISALLELSPNAVIVGFLVSFVGGVVTMFILPLMGLSVIIPGLVAHFYIGAGSAIYGNATGGKKGAIVGAFVNGILLTLLPALLMPLLSGMGFSGTTFGDPDFAIIGLGLGYLMLLL
ncbi:PTS ascorbate transporter subunit IIC [Pectobacterium sp. A535-S3-A17]|uniref:Ascorbate-specific PTS system EIIC component n=1 Tax=Pectobacterium carotovorum TaxID=554 RepID=A0A419ARS6_PECCA|nr:MULTISPECIES: PTS ascorbate transporter subunit IIC [Pectobacterium]MBE5215130.1 PTS ascorbate transporter subunit IIC [Pectobacterium quasiaquaticum]MBE5224558.1 PTS ascorbate transporter subunit IIC [Pectobacterium quasiaquaticum]RJL47811.1 PTS ascorbate transporter subunit IIC [Pectobacterium carotovorum]